MPYIGLGIHTLIALFFAIHAVRSGRHYYWLMILFSFPLIGSAVYFIMEYLPEMRYSRGGRKVLKVVGNVVAPGRAVRDAELEFERSPTVANRGLLARALTDDGRHAEAAAHFEACATGPYVDDAHFVRGLANAKLMQGSMDDARTAFERLFLISNNGRTPDDDLGYAYVLSERDAPEADAAFTHAITTSRGPIARCRYAQYLQSKGRRAEARTLYEEVAREGKLAPRHTQDIHKAWYRLAADALKVMERAEQR
jgi:hypothetical protein